MADPLPVVKQFLACESISRVHESGAVVLHRPLHTMRIERGETFPYRVSELWFYAQLTSMTVQCQLSARMFDELTGDMVGTTRLLTVPSRDSAADVIEAFFLLRGVPFDHEGVFEYVLVCNGKELNDSRRALTLHQGV